MTQEEQKLYERIKYTLANIENQLVVKMAQRGGLSREIVDIAFDDAKLAGQARQELEERRV